MGLPEETTENDIDIPILIVGGGPTGLLLAYLLSKLGGPYSLISPSHTHAFQSKAS
jgi:2-polyprenyl-6-methoxyphenol hydroxylase-like FAD-dependent oxidoreductase